MRVLRGVLLVVSALLVVFVAPAVAVVPEAPVIDGASSGNESASSADLSVQIDPEGAGTSYRFEYGTSTAYGTTVPVPDGDVGAGTADVAVTQHIPEAGMPSLKANTTYHWRVVAHNENGTTVSPDHTFVYDTAGVGLPDGRAYEMVSPPHKDGVMLGGAVGLDPPSPVVSEDGSRLVLPVVDCFAGPGSCTVSRYSQNGDPYLFTRTGQGWVTTPLAPSAAQYDQASSWLYTAAGGGLFSMPSAPVGQDDWYSSSPEGLFTDIGPVFSPEIPEIAKKTEISSVNPIATADLSHLVYEVRHFHWPFDPTPDEILTSSPLEHGQSDLNVPSLYEYVGAGRVQPELVAVTGGAGSTEVISLCGAVRASYVQPPLPSDLSEDGETVFFTVEPCAEGSGSNRGKEVPARELFARIGGARTVPISQRSTLDCTAECATSTPEGAKFVGASRDGSKAVFMSRQRLVNGADEGESEGGNEDECSSTAVGGAGCNLYEYDFTNSSGRNLVLASAADSTAGGPHVQGGPRVQGVMAVAPDGSHVYFVARGVLTNMQGSDGESARDGAENLYVFERDARFPEGHVAFIATLGEEYYEASQWGAGNVANVTPDGRFLVFTSHLALTADDTRPEGPAQVYRYDAQTGELVRVSIGELGFNDNGNAGEGNSKIVSSKGTGEYEVAGVWRTDPTMSHDGSFVFFTSPIGLTPGALNDAPLVDEEGFQGYAQNVYEWHEGHVYLISDGRDTTISLGESSVSLVGGDATGANVFFATADSLVPADTDTQLDYYDARICTAASPCLSAQFTPSVCEGEACRGAPGVAPSSLVPGSSVFAGTGNLVPVHAKAVVKPKRKKVKPRRRVRRRKATGSGRTGVHVKRGRK